MEKMVCINCSYIYHPEKGDSSAAISPNTSFEELPDGWVCPVCYASKESFDVL